MADWPHFALPFRFLQTRSGQQIIAVNEEDSLDEIGDSVELILRTEQGQRRTDPAFGRPQELAFFTDRDLVRSMVQQAIDAHEPRVTPLLRSEAIDPNDPGVHRIRAMYEVQVEPDES